MKFKLFTAVFLMFGTFTSCSIIHPIAIKKIKMDYQAHRGGRGLMPENTIAAMLSVMDNALVTTLEMDLAITKDKQVVVSHDPILNPLITTKPDGSFIKADELNKNIIYQILNLYIFLYLKVLGQFSIKASMIYAYARPWQSH